MIALLPRRNVEKKVHFAVSSSLEGKKTKKGLISLRPNHRVVFAGSAVATIIS